MAKAIKRSRRRSDVVATPPPAAPDAPCSHAAVAHDFHDKDRERIRNDLLEWFDSNRRRLPWRGDTPPYTQPLSPGRQVMSSDAYGVWVSEIMLQQTRVDTVIPFYEKWMARFPTLAALSSADIEEVNELWAGLGYYRRARFLHEGARYVMQQFSGQLPSTIEELKTIPGIGDYTAGAISSIAYNQPSALVDGNVVRVLSRLRAISAAPNHPAAVKLHWHLARSLLDQGRPGDFNQAMMELGACVCTQINPSCSSCPIAPNCFAYQGSIQFASPPSALLAGNSSHPDVEDAIKSCPACTPDNLCDNTNPMDLYPLKKIRKTAREQTHYSTIVEWQGRILLVKRPRAGLLADQWDFVGGESSDYIDTIVDAACIECRQSIGSIVHIFSHIRMTFVVDFVQLSRDSINVGAESKWVPRGQFSSIALTTGVKKIWKLFESFVDKPPTKQRSIRSFFSKAE